MKNNFSSFLRLLFSFFFSQPTRYVGFVSRLARASDTSGFPSQMEPRGPSLSLTDTNWRLSLFFAINRIPDGSSLLRKDARKDARWETEARLFRGRLPTTIKKWLRAQCVRPPRSAAFVTTN